MDVRLALLYDLLGLVAEALRLRDEVFQVVEVVLRDVIEVDDLFPVGGVDRAVRVIWRLRVVLRDRLDERPELADGVEGDLFRAVGERRRPLIDGPRRPVAVLEVALQLRERREDLFIDGLRGRVRKLRHHAAPDLERRRRRCRDGRDIAVRRGRVEKELHRDRAVLLRHLVRHAVRPARIRLARLLFDDAFQLAQRRHHVRLRPLRVRQAERERTRHVRRKRRDEIDVIRVRRALVYGRWQRLDDRAAIVCKKDHALVLLGLDARHRGVLGEKIARMR